MPIADRCRAIVGELAGEFLERRDVAETLMVTVLAKQHAILYGPPGTGKSALVRALTGRFDGARYWETLLDRLLPPEFVFGPIDLKAFEATGVWHRNVDGYLPTAHIAFGDEIGKAGPTVLNPLLTALNERVYHNNSKPMPVPLISFIGASNEILEAELAAIRDRFLVHVFVDYVQEPGNFTTLLDTATGQAGSASRTTIDLAELLTAIDHEVPAVTVPAGIRDALLELRVSLAAEGVTASDRRWKQSVRLLQASAYLDGRSAVDDDDLPVLRHVLWTALEHAPVVEGQVLAKTSPANREAVELSRQLDDIDTELAARAGEALDKRIKYATEAQFKAGEIEQKAKTLQQQAQADGRSTAKLDETIARARNLKLRLFNEVLGTGSAA
jgi:MoxR-like ATPase